MKETSHFRCLIPIIILLNFSNISFCQNSPYFNSTSKWFYGGGFFGGGQTGTYHQLNYVEGDTTINNELYFKIYSDHQDTTREYPSGQIAWIDSSKHQYDSALREDLGKVYQVGKYDSIERHLFDYRLSLGDTVIVNCPDTVLITRVDTVSFAGSFHNIFALDSGYAGQIIEGVGTRWGLSVDCPTALAIHGTRYLYCYSMNGDTMSVDGGSCSVFATEITVDLQARTITVPKIFPNPFSDRAVIQVEGFSETLDFSLYDMTGRLKKKIVSKGTNQIELKREDLAEGIYFYRIMMHGKYVGAGKVMIL